MTLSVHLLASRSIERESNMTKVPRQSDVLTLALATSQALRALVGLKLAKLGLASGQDRMLIALAEHESLSVSALAAELNVRPSTVSKMMDRLTARGLTQRRPDIDDARRINVELTPEGHRISHRLRALWNDIDTDLMADLTPQQSSQIVEGLALLSGQVRHRLRRLR